MKNATFKKKKSGLPTKDRLITGAQAQWKEVPSAKASDRLYKRPRKTARWKKVDSPSVKEGFVSPRPNVKRLRNRKALKRVGY